MENDDKNISQIPGTTPGDETAINPSEPAVPAADTPTSSAAPEVDSSASSSALDADATEVNLPAEPEPVDVIEAVAVEEPEEVSVAATPESAATAESAAIAETSVSNPELIDREPNNDLGDPFHPRKKSIFRRLIPLYITLAILAGLGAVGYFVVWPMLKENKATNSLRTPSTEEEEELLSEEAQKLQRALEEGDYFTVTELAESGYAEAFYPLALHCLEIKDYEGATSWAERSIDQNLHVKECYDLIAQINDNKKDDDLAARLLAALDTDNFSEVVRLAIDGYVDAYYYAAHYYYTIGNYESATLWAERSIEENAHVSECRDLLTQIEEARKNPGASEIFDTPEYPYETPAAPTPPNTSNPEQPKTDNSGSNHSDNSNSSSNTRTVTDEQRQVVNNTVEQSYGLQAEAMFARGAYDPAHNLAIKALEAGVDTDRARNVIKKLKSIDYYYDREANRRAAARLCPDLF